MKADFAISMVVFNTPPETLEKAISSLAQQTIAYSFVLVDHSPNKKYQNTTKNIGKYLSRTNTGYGAGNNAGIDCLENSEFVVLLNPDVILPPETLQIVKQIFIEDQEKKIGILSGKILNPDHSWQNLNKRYPSVTSLFGRRFPFLQNWSWIRKSVEDYEMLDCDSEREQEVEFLPGCFLAMRRDLWEEVQGFDENFFLYFEDFDLCQKVKTKGYKVIYSPRFSVVHEYQRKTHSSLLHFLFFLRSMVRFFWKWGFRWK